MIRCMSCLSPLNWMGVIIRLLNLEVVTKRLLNEKVKILGLVLHMEKFPQMVLCLELIGMYNLLALSL